MKEGHPEGLTIDVGQGIRQTVHVTLQNIPEIVWRVPLHDSVWEAMKKSRSTVGDDIEEDRHLPPKPEGKRG